MNLLSTVLANFSSSAPGLAAGPASAHPFSLSSPTLLAQGFLEWLHLVFFREQARGVHGNDADELFMDIWWLSVFFFVVLMVLMVYWTIKYRRRPGTIAQPSASHNTPLEVAWTVIPLGILAVIFFKGFHGYMNHAVAPAGAIELDLQAQKWDWLVTYPDGETSPAKKRVGDKDVPIFVVPAGVPVRMKMHSIDVIHSFWVPDFRGKFDVMPNRYTSYWFQADQPNPDPTNAPMRLSDGTDFTGYEDHWIFCAEYCGDSHSEMTGIIRAVPEDVYRKVLKSWGTDGLSPVELGKRMWTTRCSSCHSNDGKAGTGPTWKDIYGHAVEFTDGTALTPEQAADDTEFANYIRESILYPSKRIVKGYPNQMASFQGLLDEKQITGIIAYIKTLSDKAPKADAAPAAAPAAGTK